MSRARLLPHLTVAPDAITWGAWWVELDSHRQPVESRLKGWDYASNVRFEIQPSVDVKRALTSSGTATADEVSLLALLDCPATGLRLASRMRLSDTETGGRNVLALSPKPGSLAQRVDLSVHLVLSEPGISTTDGRAWRPGSRLASSETTRVRLEGDDPRFPTESVSFKSLSLESAAWTVQMRFAALDESFLGGVRLLLNKDHPASELILDGDGAVAGVVSHALKVDVVRQIVLHVAHDNTLEVDRVEWPEGSVGAVLDALLQSTLAMNLSSAAQLVRTDYVRFERKLQSGLDFLVGVQ